MTGTPLLVVITGPSGVGKDSLVARLKERPGSTFGFAVTATSRPPREGEVDGRDYHFVTREEFERMVGAGEMLEHAVVYGQLKGVPKRSVRKVLDEGKHVLLRTDIQGARTLKTLVPDALTIFLAPPSAEEMERRLRERATDSPEQIETRLATAIAEMDTMSEFDHSVVNDDLDRAAGGVEEIIARERNRPGRKPIELA